MGGKSKSSSSSSNDTTTVNEQVNSAVEDVQSSNILNNSGDNVNVTTTDFGAIKAAEGIAYESLEITSRTANAALDNSQQALQSAINSVQSVASAAQTQGQSVVAESLVSVFRPFMLAIVAGLGLLLVANVFKRVKA